MKNFFLIVFLIVCFSLYGNDQLLDAVNSVRLKIALDNLNRFCENIEMGINIVITTAGILTYRELRPKFFWGKYPVSAALLLTFLLGAGLHGALHLYKGAEAKKITQKTLKSDFSLCTNNN